MDKVRMLKWEYNPIACEWHAETKFVTYKAYDEGYWYADGLDDGYADTAAAAMDACETDYIARCSEFLRVAGPGECVVKVEDVIEARRILTNLRQRYGSNIHREPVDDLIESLTAAIDAARKEGGK